MTTAVFEILAEPNRRRVLDLLREQEHSVGELVDALDLSQPAVSKHLRVLRDAGLVSEVRVGRERRYRLEPAPLRAVADWVRQYERFWSERLGALGEYLDRHTPRTAAEGESR